MSCDLPPSGPDFRHVYPEELWPDQVADQYAALWPDILSDLTDQLRAAGMADPFGTLRLYTERAPCDSCASILREFKSRYPHVKIEVYNDFTVEGVAL